MGTSYLDNKYTINGLVDTGQKVLDNLNTLCNSCGTWLTYDIYTGRWSVIINESGTSTWSFTDNNIVGALTVSGTGVDNLANGIRVTYPRDDLQNKSDWIEVDIPTADWYPNESVNIREITYPLVVDPVQAKLLGFIELKQSRVDKVVKFTTDYTSLGITAGDLIDITNTVYGWNKKMFRVITVSETDDDNGNLLLEITGLEYDATVYDTTNLDRYTVVNENGIVSIGAIPAPTNFTVTKYETDARPRVDFSATVSTGGLVEGVEFWTTTQTDVTVDNDRYYQLSGTARPVNGNTFPSGQVVSYSVDSLVSGNFYAKARSVNSKGVSPFTDITGFVYTPVQTTQAVDSNTQAPGISSLGGQLGMMALMALLNSMFSGNSGAGGSAVTSALGKLWKGLTDSGTTSAVYVQPTDPVDDGAGNVAIADGAIWYETDA